MDGPPFPGLSQDADAELVLGHLAPEHLDGWIEAAWKQGAEPPTDLRVIRTRDPDDPVTAELPDGIAASVAAPAESLLTASADPHIGRYAGLVTTDPTPVPEGGVRPGIWLVASQWAVRTRPGSPLDALLDSSTPTSSTSASSTSPRPFATCVSAGSRPARADLASGAR